jgi:hypothetical protein
VVLVKIKRGTVQLKHTHGTLSILSTNGSLPRATGLANPTGVEDLGTAGLVGGTRKGLMSNALGRRPSATSGFAERGAISFVLKLFKWKFSTLALQTAHCMSFSPTIFKALLEMLFCIYPKAMKRETHLVRQAEQRGWAQGSKIARVFARSPQMEQPETSGLIA